MKRNATTPESLDAAATRRTVPWNCRSRSDETLTNSIISTALVRSHVLTRSRSHALPIYVHPLPPRTQYGLTVPSVPGASSQRITQPELIIDNCPPRTIPRCANPTLHSSKNPLSHATASCLRLNPELPQLNPYLNRGLTSISLERSSKIPGQSDLIQANTGQRAFLNSFRPNPAYGQVRVNAASISSEKSRSRSAVGKCSLRRGSPFPFEISNVRSEIRARGSSELSAAPHARGHLPVWAQSKF
jgi:hypothetical protein